MRKRHILFIFSILKFVSSRLYCCFWWGRDIYYLYFLSFYIFYLKICLFPIILLFLVRKRHILFIFSILKFVSFRLYCCLTFHHMTGIFSLAAVKLMARVCLASFGCGDEIVSIRSYRIFWECTCCSHGFQFNSVVGCCRSRWINLNVIYGAVIIYGVSIFCNLQGWMRPIIIYLEIVNTSGSICIFFFFNK